MEFKIPTGVKIPEILDIIAFSLQSSGARILNCLKISKTVDQTVPFSADDVSTLLELL